MFYLITDIPGNIRFDSLDHSSDLMFCHQITFARHLQEVLDLLRKGVSRERERERGRQIKDV
jgi:hypothetical protein